MYVCIVTRACQEPNTDKLRATAAGTCTTRVQRLHRPREGMLESFSGAMSCDVVIVGLVSYLLLYAHVGLDGRIIMSAGG